MFLNLSNNDTKRYIYRITTIDRVKQLFQTNKNVLVKPALWEDPFENFILRSPVRLNSGQIVEYNHHDAVYGQCWTTHKASDAMWRIYATDKRGIRLRSTVGALIDQIRSSHPEHTDARCCIGKVRYLSSSKMKKVANSTFDDFGISIKKLFGSLLIKRPAFSHEREIRLLYFELDELRQRSEIYEYSVDPHQLISQIMLDPRLTQKEANDLKSEIRAITGFRGPILRSLLYAAPKRKILGISEWTP